MEITVFSVAWLCSFFPQSKRKHHSCTNPKTFTDFMEIMSLLWFSSTFTAEQNLIYCNKDTQGLPSKNSTPIFDSRCAFWGTNKFHEDERAYMFTAEPPGDVCGCLRLCFFSASAVSYIILLLSCRNCLDSYLAGASHPFVIRRVGPWLLGPRDSSKINWLEMTSARICHRSARRYHKWNHKL